MNKKRHLTDIDILKRHHKQLNFQNLYRFVRDNDDSQKKYDPADITDKDYGDIIAKKYYDKLYKEFAIVDLSRYQSGKIGMRWRTEKEVVTGKGENICAVKACDERKNLSTYEVPFSYKENDEKKITLVKCRCCKECSVKLNYKKKHPKFEE